MSQFRLRLTCYFAALGALLLIAGCGPRLSESELGQIVPGVPRIPGAEKPFPMPQLETPAEITAPPESAGDSPAAESSQPESAASPTDPSQPETTP